MIMPIVIMLSKLCLQNSKEYDMVNSVGDISLLSWLFAEKHQINHDFQI